MLLSNVCNMFVRLLFMDVHPQFAIDDKTTSVVFPVCFQS